MKREIYLVTFHWLSTGLRLVFILAIPLLLPYNILWLYVLIMLAKTAGQFLTRLMRPFSSPWYTSPYDGTHDPHEYVRPGASGAF